MKTLATAIVISTTIVAAAQVAKPQTSVITPAAPLTMGETFTIESKLLGETRRINVYLPPQYTDSKDARLPVLYMPDGGMAEDFLHVAGLVQVSTGNETMRPFMLVGIENTQRRRDLTGPTNNANDKKIAPVVGGSEAFRAFIRTELIPLINSRYRTTGERAIIGESLAGLFIVETFFQEPELFDTYIAFDPSVWWNDGEIVKRAAQQLPTAYAHPKALYLAASSDDIDHLTATLSDTITAKAPAGLTFHYEPMPGEQHSTIYHPAAIAAIRWLFKPAPPKK